MTGGRVLEAHFSPPRCRGDIPGAERAKRRPARVTDRFAGQNEVPVSATGPCTSSRCPRSRVLGRPDMMSRPGRAEETERWRGGRLGGARSSIRGRRRRQGVSMSASLGPSSEASPRQKLPRARWRKPRRTSAAGSRPNEPTPRGGGEAGQSAEVALHRLPRTAWQRPGFVSANILSSDRAAGD
jgi:hypothetical protein